MLLVKYALGAYLIFMFQHSFAETDNTSEEVNDELDTEFIEVLGTVETEEGEWFDIFLSTLDEAEEEGLSCGRL